MLYWLIPYLVAYNASHVSDWKYGPEHVFKAEIRTDTRDSPDLPFTYIDVDIYIPCRTMNVSSIECRIESTNLERYKIGAEGYRFPADVLTPGEMGLNDIVFQVEFNKKGMNNIRFMNDSGDFKLDMIRAIIGIVNLDFDPVGKHYKTYVSMDNSTIGTCNTNITLSSYTLQSSMIKPETLIKGYSFDVPTFKERSGDVVVIEKHRNLNNCSKWTPYFFASPGNGEDPQRDKKCETKIASSRSLMYFGQNSFSAYTTNIGSYTISSLSTKKVYTIMNYHEVLRVSLDSIRPATEKNSNDV